MVYDLIALIIIILSLIFIVIIVVRKFPVLGSIDLKNMSGQKHKQLKNGILNERIKRKSSSFVKKIFAVSAPVFKTINQNVHKYYQRILEIEKKYKEKTTKKPVTREEKIERNQKTELLLAQCKELVVKEDFQEAEKKCIEVISLDPKNIEAYYNLGEIYTYLKDYEHAKEIYKFLVKLNAQDDIAYSGLGNIAAAMGNFQEAKDDYIHSIILNSKIASHHVDLSQTYMALGDQTNALKSCQEAVKLEPKNPRNLDALLKVSILAKNKSIAIRTFDKLKKVNPENQKLGELKKEIDKI